MAMNFVRNWEAETIFKRKGYKGVRAWKCQMSWVHFMILHDPEDTKGDWHTCSYELNPALTGGHRQVMMIDINSRPMITRYSAGEVMRVYDGIDNAKIACALTLLYLQQKLGLQ